MPNVRKIDSAVVKDPSIPPWVSQTLIAEYFYTGKPVDPIIPHVKSYNPKPTKHYEYSKSNFVWMSGTERYGRVKDCKGTILLVWCGKVMQVKPFSLFVPHQMMDDEGQ